MDSNTKYILQGDDLVAKGMKKAQGGVFSGLFGSKAERLESCIELYKQAATNYKLGKAWEKATEIYAKCANLSLELKNQSEAADFMSDAANSIRNVNSAEAVTYWEKSCEILITTGDLGKAARMKKTVAETYERDGEYSLASKFFYESADLFATEGELPSMVNQMKLKGADCATQNLEELTKIKESVDKYLEVSDSYMLNKLTSSSAKDLFFKASLLLLVLDDPVGSETILNRCIDKDPGYGNSREAKFVQGIINAIHKRDPDGFATECYNFNKIITLDKWKTNVLTKIKSIIPKATGALQEDDPL